MPLNFATRHLKFRTPVRTERGVQFLTGTDNWWWNATLEVQKVGDTYYLSFTSSWTGMCEDSKAWIDKHLAWLNGTLYALDIDKTVNLESALLELIVRLNLRSEEKGSDMYRMYRVIQCLETPYDQDS